jgi:hypothetical protein
MTDMQENENSVQALAEQMAKEDPSNVVQKQVTVSDDVVVDYEVEEKYMDTVEQRVLTDAQVNEEAKKQQAQNKEPYTVSRQIIETVNEIENYTEPRQEITWHEAFGILLYRTSDTVYDHKVRSVQNKCPEP